MHLILSQAALPFAYLATQDTSFCGCNQSFV